MIAMEWITTYLRYNMRHASRDNAINELKNVMTKGDRLCREIKYGGDIPSELEIGFADISFSHYTRCIITDGDYEVYDTRELDAGPSHIGMARCRIRNANYVIIYDEADCGDREWWDEDITIYGDKELYERIMKEIGEYKGGICC